jgi:glycosyltransferase involved in cell wall biosynthesis
LNVWLITVGEPLPIDPGKPRLLRAGLLAQMLNDAGHQVTWWSSTFDHWRKQHRYVGDNRVEMKPGYVIRLLRGYGYRRNVSLSRLIDHWQIARKFRDESRARMNAGARPDVILCSFPPIELAREATRFGREFGVPAALDIRDLWPDIFINLAPDMLTPLARTALTPYFNMAREACREAAAILGITEPFVDWGLNYAARPRSPLDRAFPMAYPSTPPSEDEQRKAIEYWRAQGVTRADGKFTVVFAGTIGRQFEFEPVIEAAKALPDLRFIICGTGDRFDFLRDLAKDAPNVMLPGWVGAAEIWTLMRIAQAGLAPYHDEDSFTQSLPNKPVEYLSAGLPVVSSLPGALASLLSTRDCGVTYPNRDGGALRAALQELRGNPKRREEMARNAKATYDEQFRAENVYTQMIAHLQDIATARPCAPRNR